MKELILGHRGMVGSAMLRLLPNACRRIGDLRCSETAKDAVLANGDPYDVLYLCAAKVGGIAANMQAPGQFIYDNLMIQANVIEAARMAGVKLIVFLGSSCIYPGDAGRSPETPLTEDRLLAGPLEPTNEAYAIAKIAGIKMLEAYSKQYGMEYLAVMPCNLYGPGDNYDPETSHFLPGMIRRFHEAKVSGAKSVELWGTGTPRRELMHVDDCARIIIELVKAGARGLINIGAGFDCPISFFADLVCHVVLGGECEIEFDSSRPDGVMRKLMDVSRMRGFNVGPEIRLPYGVKSAYQSFLESHV